MPESKSRNKKKVTAKAEKAEAKIALPGEAVNPRWLAPVMVGLMVLGLAWIVTFYLTSADLGLPIPQIGQWNLAVGFGLIIVGFGLTTRWR
ncbi:cell division protein CrgA [Promicromonospora soli]|uniref:Cell division protein CrgA n=1 Tax=Promicromonospora soli TaxID=2035533 RepID=A0A919FQY5_9MICO|nr:cell division protein CrgA [Promicromonospora soli]GHH70817.1 cell division protein CrgA [Promicromonospora soli]